ncbi:MAG TPA: hypothetical protein VMZ91_04450 [Candidatus Paceibacterota bacterium]|nr:hypothetical protein [Candidatus Paceibacterota bacterium]
MLDKKTGVLLIVLFSLLILNLFAVSVKAQLSDTGLPSGLEGDVEKIQNLTEKGQDIIEKTKEEEGREYLKQEWKKMLEQNKVGKVLLAISDFIEKLNPFFKIVLGVEYSLSWAFVFAIALWIILFMILYYPIKGMFDKTWIAIIASFAVTSLIGISGVIKKAVDLLSTIISKPWLAWLALGITIVIAAIIIYLGGGLKQILEKEREKAAKEKTEKDRKIIETSAKVEKENLKGYTKK